MLISALPKMTPAFDESAPINDASPNTGSMSGDYWPHYNFYLNK